MIRYRKAQSFPQWKAWRDMLSMQHKSNSIVSLYDNIIQMALQGYEPAVKTPRALLRQAKKRGVIFFRKKV